MIRVEVEDFSVDVPIERRMSVEQFLSVADRLEHLFGSSMQARLPASQQGTPSEIPSGFTPVRTDSLSRPANSEQEAHESLPPHLSHSHEHESHSNLDAFRFEREEEVRVEYLMSRLLHKLEAIENTQRRLEVLESNLLGRVHHR